MPGFFKLAAVAALIVALGAVASAVVLGALAPTAPAARAQSVQDTPLKLASGTVAGPLEPVRLSARAQAAGARSHGRAVLAFTHLDLVLALTVGGVLALLGVLLNLGTRPVRSAERSAPRHVSAQALVVRR